MKKTNLIAAAVLIIIALSAIYAYAQVAGKNVLPCAKFILSTEAVSTEETAKCLACHSKRQKRLVETWEASIHAKNAVGCYECHGASSTLDPAAKNGHFGVSVQLVVSPLKCAECHQEQYASFASSSHALAFDKIKNDPIKKLCPMIFEQSCAKCHGTDLKMKRGKPLDNTWPNLGIGRINTDGSRGCCAACHGHHDDSMARVRSSECCMACHNADFSPALEAWAHSRHGISWAHSAKSANLEEIKFNPSDELLKKPNCYTCHLAPAAEAESATHNPTERISWQLAQANSVHAEAWGQKRLAMQEGCRLCHAPTQIDMFYRRFDALVLEFNGIYEKLIKTDNLSAKKLQRIKKLLIKGKTAAAMQSSKHVKEAFEELNNILSEQTAAE